MQRIWMQPFLQLNRETQIDKNYKKLSLTIELNSVELIVFSSNSILKTIELQINHPQNSHFSKPKSDHT